MALETPRYPLDKNQLGNASWKVLHSYAAGYPDNPSREDKQEFHSLLKAVVRTIPEGDCKCKSHAIEYIQKKNPKMGNRKDLVEWLCEFHNDTNKRAAKPTIDCTELLRNTGDCPSCKIKPKEKVVTAADKDGPLKSVLGDYKQMSIKVFEELCHREGIPVPKIIFAPCPSAGYTSCTTFLVDRDKAVIKQGDEGREPTVYINPNNFGLRVLIHEWHEYQRQMKAEGHYKPKDEETVERHTKEIIRKYFPSDYYDHEKQQLVQPMVMKDEVVADVAEAAATAVQEKPYSFRDRKNYRSSFSTEEFPLFSKYREKQKLAAIEELEASKSESSGMLSYFDALYEPFAKLMNLSARDVNLANTPNIFQQGAKIALDSQLTPFGTLVASSVMALGLFAATILNKDGIGISDRRLLSYLGSNFLWSGLESATLPSIKQTASQVGAHLANMEFDQITKLMVNDNSVFAGLTEAQAQQQVGVQRRAQQRAAGMGVGGRGVAGRAGGAAAAGPPPTVAESVIERVQQRALNPEGNQPASIKTFKNFPSPATAYGAGPGSGAVPRTDSAGGRGFTYSPTPASPYDMPQDEIDYNAMLGIPTEPTELLPSRNLGMTLSPDDLEELR